MTRHNSITNNENETLKAGGLILNDGKILLVSSNGEVFGIPKGHLEEGESLEAGGIREIKEETGYAVEITRKLPCIQYEYEATGEKVFLQYYLYKIISGNLGPEPGTFLEWFTKEEAFRVVPYQNEKEVIEVAFD